MIAVLFMSYDRQALRHLEWMCLIRRQGSRIITVRFLNDKFRDSGEHGQAIYQRSVRYTGSVDVTVHFNCCGARALAQYGTWVHLVRCDDLVLRGHDSRNRFVVAAPRGIFLVRDEAALESLFAILRRAAALAAQAFGRPRAIQFVVEAAAEQVLDEDGSWEWVSLMD